MATQTFAAPADQYFDSDGVRIRYVERGSGEAVVLIHGLTDYIERAWIEAGTFDRLAEHYHVIALDCRGHGKSGKPHDPGRYGLEVSQDVIRLLDHLGIEKAHIVGYSMGAGVTASLLARHPERFLTATLGGAAPGRSLPAAILEAWAAEMERGSMASLIVAAIWPNDQPPPTEEQFQETSAFLIAGNDPVALAALLRGALTVQPADLTWAKVPILGVCGSADSPLARLKEMTLSMPHHELVEIPGADHRAARLRPEFGEAVERFLAAHPAIFPVV
jgi:pimeloyl-ACP methyl ester carboxylesterase